MGSAEGAIQKSLGQHLRYFAINTARAESVFQFLNRAFGASIAVPCLAICC
jgi:hypothetical protein